MSCFIKSAADVNSVGRDFSALQNHDSAPPADNFLLFRSTNGRVGQVHNSQNPVGSNMKASMIRMYVLVYELEIVIEPTENYHLRKTNRAKPE